MDRISLDEERNELTTEWIDISVPIYSGMVHWPDNPPVKIERIMDLTHGDAANVSKIEMGAHTGTHMDAPRHFFADGAGLDEMPLEAVIGPAWVIQIEHPNAIIPAELEAHNLQAGERVLFRTRNSERCWKNNQFIEDFVYISAAARNSWLKRKCAPSGLITSQSGVMYTMGSKPIKSCSSGDLAYRRAQPLFSIARYLRACMFAPPRSRCGWGTSACNFALIKVEKNLIIQHKLKGELSCEEVE